MNILEKLRNVFRVQKDSQARIVTSINQIGKPVHTPGDYAGLATQGYSKNVTVYAAIQKVATACAGIEWVLYSKKGKVKTEIHDHALITLLEKPNPLQARASFIEALIAYRLISGNTYIEGVSASPTKPPLELWPVRPDKMKVVPNARGFVGKYVFEANGMSREWLVDQVDFKSPICHWKTFNPINDWYGLSPLQAALLSLDSNNAGKRWNLSLLQHSATPSGVLQFKTSDANPRGELTDDQYKRIKNEFENGYTGSRNAGKPLLLEGGLVWQSMSLSPKDMDFVNSNEVSATDIALAFGVPPELLGLGEKTYSNYQEAKGALYTETILPLMDSLRDMLNMWLVPAFGEGLYLDYDRDDIEALYFIRKEKYASLQPVTFLTINEKREAVGFEEIEGGDVLPGVASAETDVPNENDDPNADEKPDDGDKPKPDDKPVDDSEDDSQDDGKSLEWKSINLLNANEKRASWKRQNAKRNMLAAGFERDLKNDFKDLTKKLMQAANLLKDKDPANDAKLIEYALIRELDQFMPHIKKTMAKNIRYTLEDFGQMVLREGKSLGFDKESKANMKYDSFVDAYIERHTGTQIRTIENTNSKNIRRIVGEWVKEATTSGDSNQELSKFLEAEFEELTPASARRIARTEVSMASTNGSLEAVKSLQVPGMVKEWVTASDDRVRDGEKGGPDHEAMNGDTQPIDEKFTVPPDTSMDGPGDPNAGADQVINCRCVLTYKNKGK